MRLDSIGPALVAGGERSRVQVWFLTAVLAVPFLVLAVVQTRRRWYPSLDQAMIELLVSDVGGANSPTTGLVGRFLVDGIEAKHPGPLGWYVLAPVYRLLGSSANALTVSNLVLEFVAVALLLWIVARRDRPALLLITGIVAALLVRALGVSVLSTVWNPHLPVLWMLVAIVAAWSVVVGDRRMAIPLVFAGSLCAQTHISYVLPVVALVGFTIVVVGVQIAVGRGSRQPDLVWLVAAGVLFVLLSAPVLYDEFAHDPGNLSLLWRNFTGAANAPIGWHDGRDLLLVHMNPWRLVRGPLFGSHQTGTNARPSGSIIPGLVLVGCWCFAAALSLRIGDRLLKWFHVTVAVVVVASLFAATQILPIVFYWVAMYLWVTQAALLIAVTWTVVVPLEWSIASWRREPQRARLAAAALGLVVLISAWSTVQAADGPRLAESPQSRQLAALVPPTIEALRSGTVPMGGQGGVYLVDWSDPYLLGSAAYGLLDELERAGFAAGVREPAREQARDHRVLQSDEPTAEVRYVTGPEIGRVLAMPGAVQVAFVDLRTDADVARYREVRAQLITELRRAGRGDLVPAVDNRPISVVFASFEIANRRVNELAGELVDLGAPAAIIVLPRT